MGLSNSKYNEIMREYEKRQQGNRRRQIAHLNEVYERIPEYKKTEDQIADISVIQAKKLILGNEEALPALQEQLLCLREKKSTLLRDYGFPEDYLEPSFTCPDCRDTGYIGNKKCHCFRQRQIEILYEQSNIKNILSRENFDFFSYEYYNEEEMERMKKVVAESKRFIREFGSHYSNLLFFGDIGNGKTFLSNCIAKELIESGYSVIYFTAFQLFDLLAKNTFDSAVQTDASRQMYSDIFECDLLIIDDLGTENANSFTSSQFFLILNERHLRKHSTIISTNMSIQMLNDTYSERSVSRLLGSYELFLFKGRDIRPRKMKQETKTESEEAQCHRVRKSEILKQSL